MRRSFGSNRFRSRKYYGYKPNGSSGGQDSISSAKYINRAVELPPEEKYISTNKFGDFDIDERLKNNTSAHGYSVPTPIQDQAIPHVLAGRDVIGIANTGTGKTAAFLLPLINKVINHPNERVLIMVPTRELAMQVNDEFKAFCRGLEIFCQITIGGANINTQIIGLNKRPNFVIGTPGRLKDLENRRILNLGEFANVVLDEVDRMVDIGFIRDIKYLISLLPSVRQSLFFSATVSGEVNGIIQSFLKDPITISVNLRETAHNVDQDIISVKSQNEKIEVLRSMLRRDEFKKVLIFGRTKWGVERLSKDLAQNGFSVGSIHGNKSQGQRMRALSEFKNNRMQILVATDVAARGLDIDSVSHVINFDEPNTYTDYIHRIGRTGRANKMGKALTFVI